MKRPLEGITVVGLEQVIAGPFCTRQLAELGARVIKIERTGEGDAARGYDRTVLGQSSPFIWVNRSKESLALDVKRPEARPILEKLMQKADVFVQNLAPGAAERLGLGAAELRARHPRLIWCGISGYGPAGPSAGKNQVISGSSGDEVRSLGTGQRVGGAASENPLDVCGDRVTLACPSLDADRGIAQMHRDWGRRVGVVRVVQTCAPDE